MKHLVTPAILAAAVICDALGLAATSRALLAVFAAVSVAAAAFATSVILDHPRPWAAEAAEQLRARPYRPVKTITQITLLAAVGAPLTLALYGVALFLNWAARTLPSTDR